VKKKKIKGKEWMMTIIMIGLVYDHFIPLFFHFYKQIKALSYQLKHSPHARTRVETSAHSNPPLRARDKTVLAMNS